MIHPKREEASMISSEEPKIFWREFYTDREKKNPPAAWKPTRNTSCENLDTSFTRFKERSAPSTFFSTRVRGMAIVSRLLGILPLKSLWARRGADVSHSWLSPLYMWDAIALSGVFAVLHFYHVTSTEPVLHDLAFEIFIARGLVQWIICQFSAMRFPALLDRLDHWEVRAELAGAGPESERRNPFILRNGSLLLFTGVMMALSCVSVGRYQQESGNPLHKVIYVLLGLMPVNLWRQMPTASYLLFCIALKNRFVGIKKAVRKVIRSVQNKGHDATTLAAQRLEELRLLHAELAALTSLTGRAFGALLLADSFFTLISTVLDLYTLIVVSDGNIPVFVVMYFAFNLFSMLDMTVFTELMTYEANAVVEYLQSMPLFQQNTQLQAQVQLFLTQITATPIQVSAAGFFVVNSAHFSSIMGAVATYLIVMVQFSSQLAIFATKKKIS